MSERRRVKDLPSPGSLPNDHSGRAGLFLSWEPGTSPGLPDGAEIEGR